MPTYDDGKIPATVTLTRMDRGYVIAQSPLSGVEYFIFYNAVEYTGEFTFEQLELGSSVRLRPILHPRGPRGIEVEIVNV